MPTFGDGNTAISTLVRVSQIARGGMGTVEIAARREGTFRRLYAIKRLHPHLRDDSEFRDMFVDEARVAGLLQHANIVPVLDVSEDSDGPYLLMPFIHGLSLRELMQLLDEEEERLPIQTCVRIGLEVARGLHVAHEAVDHTGTFLELVHRDLSPANVLLGWDGSVRIADFGIARALGRQTKTATGVVKGKAAYMSPEQLSYEPIDRRSDLFALGVLLFEMLAGRRLYKNHADNDGMRRILREPPPDIGEDRPRTPPDLAALLFELLAKAPDRRPSTAQSVVTRLEAILADLLQSEPPLETGVVIEELTGDLRSNRTAQLNTDVDQALLKRTSEADPTEPIRGTEAVTSPRPRRRWGALAALGLGVLLAAGGVAGWATYPTEPPGSIDAPAPPPSRPSAAEPPPVAEVPPATTPEPRREPEPEPEPQANPPASESGPTPQPNRSRRRASRRRSRSLEPSSAAPAANPPGWESW